MGNIATCFEKQAELNGYVTYGLDTPAVQVWNETKKDFDYIPGEVPEAVLGSEGKA